MDNIEWDKGELEKRFGVKGGDADPMWAWWEHLVPVEQLKRWSLGQWPRATYEWIEEEPVDSLALLMESFGLKEVGPEGVEEGDAFFRYQDRLWIDGTAPKGTAGELALRFGLALHQRGLVSKAQVRAMWGMPVDGPEVVTDPLVLVPPQLRPEDVMPELGESRLPDLLAKAVEEHKKAGTLHEHGLAYFELMQRVMGLSNSEDGGLDDEGGDGAHDDDQK